MKKTLLLSALVASVASFAGTTGFVEAYDDNTTVFIKDAKLTKAVKHTTSTFGIKGEVKVSDSGFSAGGDLKVKNYMLFKDASDGKLLLSRALMKESKVWAKYELPQLKGVDTYVKGTYKVKGEVELEADAKYKKGDLTVELNSKTTLPLKSPEVIYEKEVDNQHNPKHANQHSYLENVVSTHKLSVEKEKLSVISDLKASVEVQHAYANELVTEKGKVKKEAKKEAEDAEVLAKNTKAHPLKYKSAFKYVKAEVSGAYKETKNLEVKGELGLAYTPGERGFKINGEYDEKGKPPTSVKGYDNKQSAIKEIYSFDLENKGVYGNVSDKLFIDAKYTGVKDLELTGRARLTHSVELNKEVTVESKQEKVNLNHILFDLKAGAKYTGIANTTLKGSLEFLLDSEEEILKNPTTKAKTKRENSIVLVADLGAKYDYKATDKLTISPELNIKGMLFNIINKADDTILGLAISPKVSAEYKATEKLTLKGSVETPVVFSNKTADHKMEYIGTAVKTSFNVKYAW